MSVSVYDKWQMWRNADHEDNAILSRHEIITLLNEIERLRAEIERLQTENSKINNEAV